MNSTLISTGELAQRLGISRWRLMYLLERGVLPAPSAKVPGRRLFTKEDEARIRERLTELDECKSY